MLRSPLPGSGLLRGLYPPKDCNPPTTHAGERGWDSWLCTDASSGCRRAQGLRCEAAVMLSPPLHLVLWPEPADSSSPEVQG